MHRSHKTASLAYVPKVDPFVTEANAVQAMRMVDAFASLTPHVSLPVPVRWTQLMRATSATEHARLKAHFGLTNTFRVVPIADTSLLRPGKPRLRLFHRRAVRYLARQRPELVVTRSERVVKICAQRGLPVVFETHAGPDETQRLEHYRALCLNENVVGVVTIHEKLAALYASYGVPRHLILVLPDGIPRSLLARPRADKAAARAKLGLAVDSPMVLYTGSLQRHKGVPTLLEAARQLPKVQFVLVGHHVDSRPVAGGNTIPDNCMLTGYRPPHELPTFLDAADICVLPNSSEHPSAQYTSPLKLFEYMASGTPMIASAIPAICEIVEDGKTACLFQPDNAQELSSKIQFLLANPDLGRELAKKARCTAERFTWERRAQVILDAYATKKEEHAKI